MINKMHTAVSKNRRPRVGKHLHPTPVLSHTPPSPPETTTQARESESKPESPKNTHDSQGIRAPGVFPPRLKDNTLPASTDPMQNPWHPYTTHSGTRKLQQHNRMPGSPLFPSVPTNAQCGRDWTSVEESPWKPGALGPQAGAAELLDVGARFWESSPLVLHYTHITLFTENATWHLNYPQCNLDTGWHHWSQFNWLLLNDKCWWNQV